MEVSKKIRGIDSSKFAISIFIFATLVLLISKTLADADLWGHLRFGLDMIEDREITRVDPYSYLSGDQHWINHEWLSELFFAFSWLAGGATGLIILKTGIGILTFLVIYLYLLKLNLSPIRAGSLIILVSLAVLPAITSVRPHLFTVFFSALVFVIIANAEFGSYHWLWACSPIFALWVNFHGGFLAGLGFLSIWIVFHTIFNPDKWSKIIPPVLISFLAVLLNPYGMELIKFLLRTATIPRPEIVEWQPLNPISYWGAIYFILLFITLVGLKYSRKVKRLPLLVLIGVAAILPFIAVRHLPIYAFAVIIFAGEHIGDAWVRFTGDSLGPSRLPNLISTLTIMTGLGVLVLSFSNFLYIKMPDDPIPFFPVKAVSLLKESNAEGNLGVEFNWGEYALWYLSPNIKISMDGRRETVYSEEEYQIYNSFINGINDWDLLLRDFDTNLVLIASHGPAYNLLKLKDNWELVYEDSASALFASQNFSQIDVLRSSISAPFQSTDDGIFP